MKAWADRSACDWRSEGLLHGTRLLRCVPLKIPLAADETAGHTSDNTAAAAAAAAAATTARAESVAAAQLMTQTALGVGARRVSVPVRAAPLDVFLTLMAALDGGAPGMALSKTGDNDARSGGGSGGSGGSRKPDSEGQLASSVFRAVLGRSVASVEIIDKVVYSLVYTHDVRIIALRYACNVMDVYAPGSISLVPILHLHRIFSIFLLCVYLFTWNCDSLTTTRMCSVYACCPIRALTKQAMARRSLLAVERSNNR
jgi:hypothetical protein